MGFRQHIKNKSNNRTRRTTSTMSKELRSRPFRDLSSTARSQGSVKPAADMNGTIAVKVSKKLSRQAARILRHRRLVAQERRANREHFAKVAEDTLRTIAGAGGLMDSHGTQSYFESSPSSSACADPSFSSIIGSGLHVSPSRDFFPQIIQTRQATTFYSHQSSALATPTTDTIDLAADTLSSKCDMDTCSGKVPIRIHFTSSSALTAAQSLHNSSTDPVASVGVLNAASPKRPGGAFLNGGNAQEEGIVRRSTLFDSLQHSDAGRQFYMSHRTESDGSGLQDHAMLYSPGVVVFKDDSGVDLPSPFQVEVVSSVPVNADTVRSKFSLNVAHLDIEEGIRTVMRERMTRILRLFVLRGVKNLVLGPFGVGQCQNSVDMIAEIWAELLGVNDAQFSGQFDQVLFALPSKHTGTFETAFYSRCLESELASES